MICPKCAEEMELVTPSEEDEDPCYWTLHWEDQPEWVICQAVGEHYACLTDECVFESLKDAGELAEVTKVFKARVGKLARPPEGHSYWIFAEKTTGGVWKTEISTARPASNHPVEEVSDAMVAEGRRVARKLGFSQTPELRLLTNLTRMVRLRSLGASAVITENQRQVVKRTLRKFDPEFFSEPVAEDEESS